MRVLLVGAGADVSVSDVAYGLYDGLKASGAETYYYALSDRLWIAEHGLRAAWQRMGRPPEKQPSYADMTYTASAGILERALRYEVDWVLVVSGLYLHPDALVLARRAGLKVGVVFTESPYDDLAQLRLARLVDACWTNERTSLAALRQACPNVGYYRHGYDPEKHRPDPCEVGAIKGPLVVSCFPSGTTPRSDGPAVACTGTARQPTNQEAYHDVVFVGTGFPERAEMIRAVDWSGIDLGLYGVWDKRQLGRAKRYVQGGIVSNADASALYRRAKIGLNLYRQSYGPSPMHTLAPRIRHAESLNPRAVELAACGVFHLTDERAEGREVFGDSVPSFSTPAQLGELVRGFLADPLARVEHARQAREAIAPYTFAASAAHLLADLETIRQPLAKGA